MGQQQIEESMYDDRRKKDVEEAAQGQVLELQENVIEKNSRLQRCKEHILGDPLVSD
jgi:hypothetical protein